MLSGSLWSNMISSLSVKIPSSEDLVEKNFYFLQSKENPIVEDNSLWGSAIYEVWHSRDVYDDLYSSIKQYVAEVDCALHYKDFSAKTTKELDMTKNILLEGVQFCGQEKNGLLEPLRNMLDILKRYLEAKEITKKEKLIVKEVETLSNRIVQLQVDIQVSMLDFSDKCYCQQCDDYAEFFEERSEIRKEMKRLKKNGANKEEMKRLTRLLRGLKMEFRQYKKLWAA